MKATLSLLIPAFNAGKFLPRLLTSAHAQSSPFDEIWVYNDCSTDDTAEVARKFGAKVLNGDVNRGCSVGKNELARLVETDWMHFHDADDELLPNFVELARKWMEHERSDIVLFNYWARDEATGATSTRIFDTMDLARDPRSYAIREQINAICGLYRRSSFISAGGYDEDPLILFNEDVAFHIKMAFAGLSFGAESEIAIVNHCRFGSMSSANGLKCAQAHYQVLCKLLAMTDSYLYSKEIVGKLWVCAGVLGSFGELGTACEAAQLARSLGPVPISAGSRAFRAVANLFPSIAIQLREKFIRTFKPRLREHLQI